MSIQFICWSFFRNQLVPTTRPIIIIIIITTSKKRIVQQFNINHDKFVVFVFVASFFAHLRNWSTRNRKASCKGQPTSAGVLCLKYPWIHLNTGLFETRYANPIVSHHFLIRSWIVGCTKKYMVIQHSNGLPAVVPINLPFIVDFLAHLMRGTSSIEASGPVSKTNVWYVDHSWSFAIWNREMLKAGWSKAISCRPAEYL